LFNQNNITILVATCSVTPIVLAKSTKLLLPLLFVVAVSLFEVGDRFPNILSSASGVSGQLQYKGAGTSFVLVDVVCLVSVAAGKLFSFFKYGTGYFAVIANKASRKTMLGRVC
jgi:hypothetical protein